MQGHITKRGKNSWTVVVDLERDPVTGKRRQVWRSVKGTKREAQALLTQLLHQRDTGVEFKVGGLPPEGMLADVKAVVGGEDDDGVISQAALF